MLAQAASVASYPTPWAPRVVIITAFQPELSRWITTLPLGEELPFPAGLAAGQPPLRANRSLGVLGFTSGMRPSRAAASLLALGHDARLDLRESHWLVAGIAGVDPAWGSIGSVFLPRYLVGLGGGYYIDGEGNVPHGRRHADDYGPPLPTQQEAHERQSLFVLDAALVEWAHGVASSAAVLPDSPRLQQSRAGYTAADEAPAREPPAVRFGDSLTGETFWAGRESTQMARDTTSFWSAGRATFGVTQEEDLAYASALASLQRDGGRANASRLVVLRAASDYTYAPQGRGLREWFFEDDSHMLAREAFEALVAAGLPVVRALAASEAPEDCTSYRKVTDGECADDCLLSKIGICPVSLVVRTGGLEAGACEDIGFTQADGTMDEQAGPCGELTFNQWKKPATGGGGGDSLDGGGGGDSLDGGGGGGIGGDDGFDAHAESASVVEMVGGQSKGATAGETFVLGVIFGVLCTLLALKGRNLMEALEGGGGGGGANKVSSSTAGIHPPRPGGSDDPSYAVENVETARSPL